MLLESTELLTVSSAFVFVGLQFSVLSSVMMAIRLERALSGLHICAPLRLAPCRKFSEARMVSHEEAREHFLQGPDAIDGPAWHPVMGDLQDRIPSNPNYKLMKGNQNELWSIYTEKYGAIFREVRWNDKHIVCTDRGQARRLLEGEWHHYRRGTEWVVSLF